MNSFISWIGGKKLLRKKYWNNSRKNTDGTLKYLAVLHGYCLEKKEKGMEVYNDVNSNLINLYRCVKYHPEAIQKELDGILMSRELFFDAIQDIKGLTDIQRAARFFISIKESYGTKLDSFGVRPKNMRKAVEFLKEASKRLDKVVIEHLDFEHLIRTYDREDSLFYLDPPYYDTEKYYPDRFLPEDHERLRNTLRNIKGKFILSYNDCREIRNLYYGYKILEIDRPDNLRTKSGIRRYKELIIKNY